MHKYMDTHAYPHVKTHAYTYTYISIFQYLSLILKLSGSSNNKNNDIID